MWMSVSLTLLLPRYPLSQIPFRGFLSVNFSTCSIALSGVCPSNSFLKLSAPTITPVPVRVMDTLFPNSYSLCSFPLLMHCTSPLVQGINLVLVFLLPGRYPLVQFQFIPVNINPGARFPFHVAYRPSGYGTHFLIRFPGLTLVSWVISEALIKRKDLLGFACISAATPNHSCRPSSGTF